MVSSVCLTSQLDQVPAPLYFHKESQIWGPSTERGCGLTDSRTSSSGAPRASGASWGWSWLPVSSQGAQEWRWKEDEAGPPAGLVRAVLRPKWQDGTEARWGFRTCFVLWIYDLSKRASKGTANHLDRGAYLVILSFFLSYFYLRVLNGP